MKMLEWQHGLPQYPIFYRIAKAKLRSEAVTELLADACKRGLEVYHEDEKGTGFQLVPTRNRL